MAIGVEEQRFWSLTPRKLKPYEKAHEIKEEMLDAHLWELGMYIQSAIGCVFSDKNHKEKYIDKPFRTQRREEMDNLKMSDEEKKNRTIAFFRELEQMQNKFDKSKEGS